MRRPRYIIVTFLTTFCDADRKRHFHRKTIGFTDSNISFIINRYTVCRFLNGFFFFQNNIFYNKEISVFAYYLSVSRTTLLMAHPYQWAPTRGARCFRRYLNCFLADPAETILYCHDKSAVLRRDEKLYDSLVVHHIIFHTKPF